MNIKRSGFYPAAQPDGGVLLAHLRHTGVQAEEADEARPVAREVRDGEDGAPVRAEAREHVVRVLQPAALADSRRSPDAIR